MNRTLKLSLISATAIAVMLFVIAATLLGGGTKANAPTATPAPESSESVEGLTGDESESFLAATEEMQLVLGVLVGATGVESWNPEQPSATQEESPYCDAPENTVWYLTWAGSGEAAYEELAANISNSFANSDYTVVEVSPGVVDVTGESGIRGVVTWDAEAQLVQLELVSACYEN